MKSILVLLIALLGLQPAAADPLLDKFPYPLIAVKPSEAFQQWELLRSKSGTPIIIGDRKQVERILEVFDPSFDKLYDTLEISLAKAKTHQHPASLYEYRKAEHQLFVDALRKDDIDTAEEMAKFDPLDIPEEYWGEWPDLPLRVDQLVSSYHWQTDPTLETMYITILPTDNPWEAPIYLRFGGWNANPPSDIHAAALRKWKTEFGVVPVVIQSDVMEVYVANPPTGRDASKALAIQHFIYCSDIVEQGVGDMSKLAAALDQGKFWYFWWD